MGLTTLFRTSNKALLPLVLVTLAAGMAPRGWAQFTILSPYPRVMSPEEVEAKQAWLRDLPPFYLCPAPQPQQMVDTELVEWGRALDTFFGTDKTAKPDDIFLTRPQANRFDADWDGAPTPPEVTASLWTPYYEMRERYGFDDDTEQFVDAEISMMGRAQFPIQLLAQFALSRLSKETACTNAWIKRKNRQLPDFIFDWYAESNIYVVMLMSEEPRAKGPVQGSLEYFVLLGRIQGRDTVTHRPIDMKGMAPLHDAAALESWGIYVEFECP